MATSKARDCETAGRGEMLAAGGTGLAGDAVMADRVRMWRIRIGSGGASAAHSQKAGQPRQFCGQGQDVQGRAPWFVEGSSVSDLGGPW